MPDPLAYRFRVPESGPAFDILTCRDGAHLDPSIYTCDYFANLSNHYIKGNNIASLDRLLGVLKNLYPATEFTPLSFQTVVMKARRALETAEINILIAVLESRMGDFENSVSCAKYALVLTDFLLEFCQILKQGKKKSHSDEVKMLSGMLDIDREWYEKIVSVNCTSREVLATEEVRSNIQSFELRVIHTESKYLSDISKHFTFAVKKAHGLAKERKRKVVEALTNPQHLRCHLRCHLESNTNVEEGHSGGKMNGKINGNVGMEEKKGNQGSNISTKGSTTGKTTKVQFGIENEDNITTMSEAKKSDAEAIPEKKSVTESTTNKEEKEESTTNKEAEHREGEPSKENESTPSKEGESTPSKEGESTPSKDGDGAGYGNETSHDSQKGGEDEDADDTKKEPKSTENRESKPEDPLGEIELSAMCDNKGVKFDSNRKDHESVLFSDDDDPIRKTVNGAIAMALGDLSDEEKMTATHVFEEAKEMADQMLQEYQSNLEKMRKECEDKLTESYSLANQVDTISDQWFQVLPSDSPNKAKRTTLNPIPQKTVEYSWHVGKTHIINAERIRNIVDFQKGTLDKTIGKALKNKAIVLDVIADEVREKLRDREMATIEEISAIHEEHLRIFSTSVDDISVSEDFSNVEDLSNELQEVYNSVGNNNNVQNSNVRDDGCHTHTRSSSVSIIERHSLFSPTSNIIHIGANGNENEHNLSVSYNGNKNRPSENKQNRLSHGANNGTTGVLRKRLSALENKRTSQAGNASNLQASSHNVSMNTDNRTDSRTDRKDRGATTVVGFQSDHSTVTTASGYSGGGNNVINASMHGGVKNASGVTNNTTSGILNSALKKGTQVATPKDKAPAYDPEEAERVKEEMRLNYLKTLNKVARFNAGDDANYMGSIANTFLQNTTTGDHPGDHHVMSPNTSAVTSIGTKLLSTGGSPSVRMSLSPGGQNTIMVRPEYQYALRKELSAQRGDQTLLQHRYARPTAASLAQDYSKTEFYMGRPTATSLAEDYSETYSRKIEKSRTSTTRKSRIGKSRMSKSSVSKPPKAGTGTGSMDSTAAPSGSSTMGMGSDSSTASDSEELFDFFSDDDDISIAMSLRKRLSVIEKKKEKPKHRVIDGGGTIGADLGVHILSQAVKNFTAQRTESGTAGVGQRPSDGNIDEEITLGEPLLGTLNQATRMAVPSTRPEVHYAQHLAKGHRQKGPSMYDLVGHLQEIGDFTPNPPLTNAPANTEAIVQNEEAILQNEAKKLAQKIATNKGLLNYYKQRAWIYNPDAYRRFGTQIHHNFLTSLFQHFENPKIMPKTIPSSFVKRFHRYCGSKRFMLKPRLETSIKIEERKSDRHTRQDGQTFGLQGGKLFEPKLSFEYYDPHSKGRSRSMSSIQHGGDVAVVGGAAVPGVAASAAVLGSSISMVSSSSMPGRKSTTTTGSKSTMVAIVHARRSAVMLKETMTKKKQISNQVKQKRPGTNTFSRTKFSKADYTRFVRNLKRQQKFLVIYLREVDNDVLFENRELFGSHAFKIIKRKLESKKEKDLNKFHYSKLPDEVFIRTRESRKTLLGRLVRRREVNRIHEQTKMLIASGRRPNYWDWETYQREQMNDAIASAGGGEAAVKAAAAAAAAAAAKLKERRDQLDCVLDPAYRSTFTVSLISDFVQIYGMSNLEQPGLLQNFCKVLGSTAFRQEMEGVISLGSSGLLIEDHNISATTKNSNKDDENHLTWDMSSPTTIAEKIKENKNSARILANTDATLRKARKSIGMTAFTNGMIPGVSPLFDGAGNRLGSPNFRPGSGDKKRPGSPNRPSSRPSSGETIRPVSTEGKTQPKIVMRKASGIPRSASPPPKLGNTFGNRFIFEADPPATKMNVKGKKRKNDGRFEDGTNKHDSMNRSASHGGGAGGNGAGETGSRDGDSATKSGGLSAIQMKQRSSKPPLPKPPRRMSTLAFDAQPDIKNLKSISLNFAKKFREFDRGDHQSDRESPRTDRSSGASGKPGKSGSAVSDTGGNESSSPKSVKGSPNKKVSRLVKEKGSGKRRSKKGEKERAEENKRHRAVLNSKSAVHLKAAQIAEAVAMRPFRSLCRFPNNYLEAQRKAAARQMDMSSIVVKAFRRSANPAKTPIVSEEIFQEIRRRQSEHELALLKPKKSARLLEPLFAADEQSWMAKSLVRGNMFANRSPNNRGPLSPHHERIGLSSSGGSVVGRGSTTMMKGMSRRVFQATGKIKIESKSRSPLKLKSQADENLHNKELEEQKVKEAQDALVHKYGAEAAKFMTKSGEGLMANYEMRGFHPKDFTDVNYSPLVDLAKKLEDDLYDEPSRYDATVIIDGTNDGTNGNTGGNTGGNFLDQKSVPDQNPVSDQKNSIIVNKLLSKDKDSRANNKNSKRDPSRAGKDKKGRRQRRDRDDNDEKGKRDRSRNKEFVEEPVEPLLRELTKDELQAKALVQHYNAFGITVEKSDRHYNLDPFQRLKKNLTQIAQLRGGEKAYGAYNNSEVPDSARAFLMPTQKEIQLNLRAVEAGKEAEEAKMRPPKVDPRAKPIPTPFPKTALYPDGLPGPGLSPKRDIGLQHLSTAKRYVPQDASKDATKDSQDGEVGSLVGAESKVAGGFGTLKSTIDMMDGKSEQPERKASSVGLDGKETKDSDIKKGTDGSEMKKGTDGKVGTDEQTIEQALEEMILNSTINNRMELLIAIEDTFSKFPGLEAESDEEGLDKKTITSDKDKKEKDKKDKKDQKDKDALEAGTGTGSGTGKKGNNPIRTGRDGFMRFLYQKVGVPAHRIPTENNAKMIKTMQSILEDSLTKAIKEFQHENMLPKGDILNSKGGINYEKFLQAAGPNSPQISGAGSPRRGFQGAQLVNVKYGLPPGESIAELLHHQPRAQAPISSRGKNRGGRDRGGRDGKKLGGSHGELSYDKRGSNQRPDKRSSKVGFVGGSVSLGDVGVGYDDSAGGGMGGGGGHLGARATVKLPPVERGSISNVVKISSDSRGSVLEGGQGGGAGTHAAPTHGQPTPGAQTSASGVRAREGSISGGRSNEMSADVKTIAQDFSKGVLKSVRTDANLGPMFKQNVSSGGRGGGGSPPKKKK